MHTPMELVTIVVQRKDGRKAVAAAMAAGAPAATFFYAQGTGVRQKLGFLGNLIEAEKQVILIAVSAGDADPILEAVSAAVEMEKPGHGFAFIQRIDRVLGFYSDGGVGA